MDDLEKLLNTIIEGQSEDFNILLNIELRRRSRSSFDQQSLLSWVFIEAIARDRDSFLDVITEISQFNIKHLLEQIHITEYGLTPKIRKESNNADKKRVKRDIFNKIFEYFDSKNTGQHSDHNSHQLNDILIDVYGRGGCGGISESPTSYEDAVHNVVKVITEHGVDKALDYLPEQALIKASNQGVEYDHCYSPLFIAVENPCPLPGVNNVIVEKMINKVKNRRDYILFEQFLNVQDDNGYTPLDRALDNGAFDVASVLIQYGARREQKQSIDLGKFFEKVNNKLKKGASSGSTNVKFVLLYILSQYADEKLKEALELKFVSTNFIQSAWVYIMGQYANEEKNTLESKSNPLNQLKEIISQLDNASEIWRRLSQLGLSQDSLQSMIMYVLKHRVLSIDELHFIKDQQLFGMGDTDRHWWLKHIFERVLDKHDFVTDDFHDLLVLRQFWHLLGQGDRQLYDFFKEDMAFDHEYCIERSSPSHHRSSISMRGDQLFIQTLKALIESELKYSHRQIFKKDLLQDNDAFQFVKELLTQDAKLLQIVHENIDLRFRGADRDKEVTHRVILARLEELRQKQPDEPYSAHRDFYDLALKETLAYSYVDHFHFLLDKFEKHPDNRGQVPKKLSELSEHIRHQTEYQLMPILVCHPQFDAYLPKFNAYFYEPFIWSDDEKEFFSKLQHNFIMEFLQACYAYLQSYKGDFNSLNLDDCWEDVLASWTNILGKSQSDNKTSADQQTFRVLQSMSKQLKHIIVQRWLGERKDYLSTMFNKGKEIHQFKNNMHKVLTEAVNESYSGVGFFIGMSSGQQKKRQEFYDAIKQLDEQTDPEEIKQSFADVVSKMTQNDKGSYRKDTKTFSKFINKLKARDYGRFADELENSVDTTLKLLPYQTYVCESVKAVIERHLSPDVAGLDLRMHY